jgi:hypothetical protein
MRGIGCRPPLKVEDAGRGNGRQGVRDGISADSRMRVGVLWFEGECRCARQTASLPKAGYG